MQRTTEEDDLAADRTSTGQAGDALGGDGLHDRRREVFMTRTLVDEGLEVRLGEHTTARRDGVNGVGTRCQVVEASGVGVEQGGHLVDEGTRSAGTRTIHALLGDRLEVSDLGILAAELQEDVGVRVPVLDGRGLGHDLLDECEAQGLGGSQTC